jgi:hypothetical protein
MTLVPVSCVIPLSTLTSTQSEYECPTTNTPLCLKASGQKIIKKTLPKGYDRKIKSVKCNKIKVEKPKPKPKPKPTPSPAPKPYSPPSSSY